MGLYFAPLVHVPSPPLSNESALVFALVSEVVNWTALGLVVFDFVSHLHREVKVVWKCATESVASVELAADRSTRTNRGWAATLKPAKSSISRWFLATRYAVLLQSFYFVVSTEAGRTSAQACEATRAIPYGFTLAHLPGQFVMILRVWGLCGQSSQVLWWLVLGWVVEVAVQVGANGFVQPVYIALATSPVEHTCYLAPTSALFALTFIAPSIISHVILIISLVKSWQHVQAEKVLGTSIVRIIRRDQILLVLAICLVNFVNIVLVLQQNQKAYRLIFYLPALCLSHILLTRVYFSLHTYSHPNTSGTLQLPPGLNDTTNIGPLPSFVAPHARSRPPRHSATTDSHTVDVNLDRHPSDPDSITKQEEDHDRGGTLSKKSSRTSLYSRGGTSRWRMTEHDVMELRATYPHRPSVGTPIGSVTISPAQASPRTLHSSDESRGTSNEHETVEATPIGQERPSHPTPDRASTLAFPFPDPATALALADSVPPALRSAVEAKRPSVQRVSRVPVPNISTAQPDALAESPQERYLNHHLTPPASAESAEGRAEHRFIPPRRDGVGGPRPRFVPVRPARYRSVSDEPGQLQVDSGVQSAAWTQQMFG